MERPETKISQEALFKWETMREVRSQTLPYKQPVHGKVLDVELTSGHKVQVFRADDGEFFFCHGLTFGGKQAPGGAVSPFSGKDVQTILEHHYLLIDPESRAVAGDILVWEAERGATPHLAILTEVVVTADEHLDYASKLRSKNGKRPEAEMLLERLVYGPEGYGETYKVYHRK